MAHTCPVCGSTCHCNGDIDDCCFDFENDHDGCTCCLEDEPDEDGHNDLDEYEDALKDWNDRAGEAQEGPTEHETQLPY